jgi:outer membrane protein assembly factor BamE (lipoprotein component of BamABCDE complex)
MLNAAIVGILLLAGRQQGSNMNSSGQLEVSAVVTSSVSITFDNEGKPVVVVANAPADAETLRSATQNPDSPPHARRKPAVRQREGLGHP